MAFRSVNALIILLLILLLCLVEDFCTALLAQINYIDCEVKKVYNSCLILALWRKIEKGHSS